VHWQLREESSIACLLRSSVGSGHAAWPCEKVKRQKETAELGHFASFIFHPHQ
jgi:hypothetical protein